MLAGMRYRHLARLEVQLRISKLRGPIDGNEGVELAFNRFHLGNIDVKITDQVALELLSCRLVTHDIGQRCSEERVRFGIIGCKA